MRNNRLIAITLVFLMVAGGFGFTPGLVSAQDDETYLRVGIIGDPENLNPILAWSELAWIIIGLIYEPLVRWELTDDGWISSPGLAESWEWAANGTQVTFHLFENVTWHDGTPFTAHDVNWTIFTDTWLYWWQASTSHVDNKNIKILDNYTIVLNFVMNGAPDMWHWDPIEDDTPYYYWRDQYNDTPVAIAQDYFLKSIPYLSIFPMHLWDPLMWHHPTFGVDSTDYYGYYTENYTWIPTSYWDSKWYDGICWGVLDPTWAEPRIGTGPFMFEEWIPGEYLKLKTNPNYHKHAIAYDGIEFVVYSTVETMTQGVVTGNIDICDTSITFTELGTFGENVEVMENDFLGVRTLLVNQYEEYLNASGAYEERGPKHNALLEDDVRKAIHQAINKTRLAEVAYLGTARAADSNIHDSLTWHNDNMIEFEYGTAAAIATLQAAGWYKNAQDLWQKEIDGVNETLSFTLKYVAGAPIPFVEASLLKEDLENAGFEITTVPVEATTFILDMTVDTWNFELTIDFWTQLMDPNYYIWYHRTDGGLNPVDISVPRIDEIFTLQQITQNVTERKALVDEFQQIMYDESCVIPVVYFKDAEIYRKDKWTFYQTDWTSGIYGLLNVFGWIYAEPGAAAPPAPFPIEMIAIVAGAAIILVILAVYWMKRK